MQECKCCLIRQCTHLDDVAEGKVGLRVRVLHALPLLAQAQGERLIRQPAQALNQLRYSTAMCARNKVFALLEESHRPPSPMCMLLHPHGSVVPWRTLQEGSHRDRYTGVAA